MQVSLARNVHQALPEGCYRMREMGVTRETRNGPVRMFPAPFVTMYQCPMERVLFHAERDANPFFHLMESIWMLAGRNDVEWISEFSSNIAQFSDDGRTFNGAYGFRWREWFGVDQLKMIAQRLRNDPNCRRQVLAMWDGEVDLPEQGTKDVPCNTQAYFQVGTDGRLDMMVTNRSNDMVWGTYGANAVHFSVLLEYMAALVGRPVGHYWQVSMNTHVYERHFDMMEQLALKAPQPPSTHWCPYTRDRDPLRTMPVVAADDLDAWHADLDTFMSGASNVFRTPEFIRLAVIRETWREFKDRDNPTRVVDAMAALGQMEPGWDWQTACAEWLVRRMPKE